MVLEIVCALSIDYLPKYCYENSFSLWSTVTRFP